MPKRVKVEIYKNPDRETPENVTKYVPQYKQKNIEPEQVDGRSGANILISKTNPELPSSNPRSRRAPVRQSYAENIEPAVGTKMGEMPNVGNNMEHVWSSSLDGEIIDDINIDDQQPMIDNNDVLSEEVLSAMGHRFMSEQDLKKVISSENDKSSDDGLASLEENQYMILINGAGFAIGELDVIQAEVKSLLFGEHEIYKGKPLSIEDVMVIKRIPIKIGVFLDENGKR